MRALREAGVLKQARYMSTTSGSVWLGLPLYYQTLDALGDYLGKSLAPEMLKRSALFGASAGTGITRLKGIRQYPKHIPQELGTRLEEELPQPEEIRWLQNITRRRLADDILRGILHCLGKNSFCECLVDLVPDGSLHEAYIFFSAFFFLRPFGLAAPGASYCHASDENRVRTALDNETTLYVSQDIARDLPFHVFQGAVLAPHTGREGKPLAVFPLEFSPLYVGVVPSYAGAAAQPYSGIGDMLVDAYAWGGDAISPVPHQPSSEVLVRRHQNTFNVGQLAEVAGIATAYVADFPVSPRADRLPMCAINAGEKLLPHARVWSPLNKGMNQVPRSMDAAVGDAGAYDDIGHIPLLRRRVTKMVIYDSSAVHDNSTGHDSEDLCQMTYLFAAFGQVDCAGKNPAGSPNPKLRPGTLTVFRAEEFAALWTRVRELHGAGEPVVIRGNYTVVDNAFLGIHGGWRVEIVWVFALPVRAWREALPSETSVLIEDFFPNYAASEMDSRAVISLASQFASWLTHNAALREIREMLSHGDEDLDPGPMFV